jgi:hypothetical protein
MATLEAPLSYLPHTNGANGTNGAHSDGLNDASPSAFDSSLLRTYLFSLLPPLLGATSEDLDALFEDEDFEERTARFATEGNGVMYVSKLKHDIEGASPILCYSRCWLSF